MKVRSLVIGSLVVSSIFLMAGCAGKYHKGNFENKMFEKYDANGDNYVNENEYLDVMTQRFDRCDDNQDGKITKEELRESRFMKRMPSSVDDYFETNDLNNDMAVSKDELTQQSKATFKQSDINNDNKLSSEEMKEFRMEKRFESVDLNNDGVVSKDEYKNQKSPFSK